jgi:hypothetical protein
MPCSSRQRWFVVRAVALDHIENAHRSVHGSGPGARAATQQINQAYAMLLSAQFQGFCRELHSECIDFLVAPVADPNLRQMWYNNLLFGRKLDRGNPSPSNIGSDFNRLGLALWSQVDAHHARGPCTTGGRGRAQRMAKRDRSPGLQRVDGHCWKTTSCARSGTQLAEGM